MVLDYNTPPPRGFKPSAEAFQFWDLAISQGYPYTTGKPHFYNQDYRSANNMQHAKEYVLSLDNLPPYAGTIEYVMSKSFPNIPDISTSLLTEKSVSINFNPTGTGGSPITGYHYVLKNESTGQTIKEKNLMSGQRNSFESNLDSNTNYIAFLIAVNAFGNSPENSISFKTLGTAPTAPAPEPTPTPTAEPTPTAVPTPAPIITYCVNVYTLDSGGNVLSNHYDSINITKFQQLTNEGKYVFLCEDGIIPSEQQVRNFYGYTAPVADSSINSMMVSQSVGAFILKDGRLKGEILYIANTAFNPFYYGKNLTSLVQIKSKTGIPIAVKPNVLNFTNTERDERIQIDQAVGNFKELIVDFFVWKSTTDLRAFTANKQIQVVEELPPPEEPDFKPCPIGYHKDFSGKCVPDDPLPEIPRDKLIDTLKGFLFGTVALSLLARKY